jgi:hypothetical protein
VQHIGASIEGEYIEWAIGAGVIGIIIRTAEATRGSEGKRGGATIASYRGYADRATQLD